MAAGHSFTGGVRGSVQRVVLVITAGLVITGCGAAASGSEKKVPGDATATYAVALTQVAGAKSSVATATAKSRAAQPTPTATTANTAPEATPTVDPFANVVPSPNFEGDILSLLPNLNELPAGYIVKGEGPMSAEQVAAAYNDQAGFLKKLEHWGFRQGGLRSFALGRATMDDQKTKMVAFNTAVIEFGSPEQSRDSMEANREYVKKGIVGDPPNITLEGLGDYAIAVQGEVLNQTTMEHWAFIWVQKGNIVLYYRAMSLGYEPMDEAVQIATASLAR